MLGEKTEKTEKVRNITDGSLQGYPSARKIQLAISLMKI